MEVKQLLKEYRLLKYIDENKANKNVAILLVSRLKELGINEDEQYSLLADLHDKAILQRLNETEIIIYGKAGGEDLGEDLVKLQLTLAALSYPKPCPKHIVKIIPERFYPHLEDIKKEYEEKKSELVEPEGKREEIKPSVFVQGNTGFFQFNKKEKKIKIGKKESNKFKLLQCLCVPSFGDWKGIDFVAEAVRPLKSSGWSDPITNKQIKIKTIENTIKELQKTEGIKGKLKYKWDNPRNKKTLHIELI